MSAKQSHKRQQNNTSRGQRSPSQSSPGLHGESHGKNMAHPVSPRSKAPELWS
ncbi:hypothetical protein B0A49_10772, partial [Cryomyces minteri]